jgi:hypothetical protein
VNELATMPDVDGIFSSSTEGILGVFGEH